MAEAIECRVAPWYYRRMGMMILILIGCGCWFIYDGAVGWPKGNRQADLFDAFQGGRDGESWSSLSAEYGWEPDGEPRSDLEELRKALEAGGTDVSWMDFAAERRLPATPPKRHPQHAIEGQFKWAYGAFIIAAGFVVVLLVNAPKKLRADGEAFYLPGGKRIPFSGIQKVDKRKWDIKGLAYVHYRDESGAQHKAVIDDLKFSGATRILDRVLEDFEGELIERAPAEEEAEEEVPEKGEEDSGKTTDQGG